MDLFGAPENRSDCPAILDTVRPRFGLRQPNSRQTGKPYGSVLFAGSGELRSYVASGARGGRSRARREMMKFSLGRRGLDPIHADADLGKASLEEYMRHENENTFLVAQIETPEAVPHIETIAAMEGVDMLFVGLGDLSANMGLLGQMDHPKLQEVVERTGGACLKHGKAAAIICSTYRNAIAFGSSATVFLMSSAISVCSARGLMRRSRMQGIGLKIRGRVLGAN